MISSEVAHRRFHPSSLGFHPAKQDFIKFVWLVGVCNRTFAGLFFLFILTTERKPRLREDMDINGTIDVTTGR